MAKLDSTIEIAASPADVFVFFVPQRMAYWYGKEMDGEIDVHCGAPEFCLSQAVRITGKLGKKEVAHTAVTVSYTHLDVYKRQVLPTAAVTELPVPAVSCWIAPSLRPLQSPGAARLLASPRAPPAA